MEPENIPKIHPWQKISLSLAGIFLALLILEFYARTTQKFIIPFECFRFDEILNHGHVPNKTCRTKTSEWDNIYNINSLGFRDKERTFKKAPGIHRILMLGDSFTEGWGVKQGETFSSLLEKKLNQNQKNRYEVINMGTSSYSPIIEYLQFKTIGLTLEPDLVIQNFDYSDFSDEAGYSKLAKFGTDNLPISVGSSTPQHLQETLKKLVEINENGADLESLKKQPSAYFLTKNFYLARILFPVQDIQTQQLLGGRPEPNDSDFELPEKYIKATGDLAKDKNIRYLLTLYPYKDHLFGQKNTAFFSKISAFGAENNIQVLNLLPIFQRNKSEALYFKHDIHGTKKFHILTADSIYNYLLDHNLIAK